MKKENNRWRHSGYSMKEIHWSEIICVFWTWILALDAKDGTFWPYLYCCLVADWTTWKYLMMCSHWMRSKRFTWQHQIQVNVNRRKFARGNTNDEWCDANDEKMQNLRYSWDIMNSANLSALRCSWDSPDITESQKWRTDLLPPSLVTSLPLTVSTVQWQNKKGVGWKISEWSHRTTWLVLEICICDAELNSKIIECCQLGSRLLRVQTLHVYITWSQLSTLLYSKQS